MAKYDLAGVDGDAFAIMAYVRRAMVREHKPQSEIDKYLEDAQSSDYDNLICVSMDMIDELNNL